MVQDLASVQVLNFRQKNRRDFALFYCVKKVEMTLLLLGTDGCHLCEEVQKILDECNVTAEYVDIALHEEWQSKFALLIPVLFHVESQRFLNWHFNSTALLFFMESLNYDESTIKPI
jgi:hypothetical protein